MSVVFLDVIHNHKKRKEEVGSKNTPDDCFEEVSPLPERPAYKIPDKLQGELDQIVGRIGNDLYGEKIKGKKKVFNIFFESLPKMNNPFSDSGLKKNDAAYKPVHSGLF